MAAAQLGSLSLPIPCEAQRAPGYLINDARVAEMPSAAVPVCSSPFCALLDISLFD